MKENRSQWGQLWMAELTLLHIMILVRCEIPLGMVHNLKAIVHPKGVVVLAHIQKEVALPDIAKIKKSQIFVLFENEASYEDFFYPQVF